LYLRAGYFEDADYTAPELCELLGVDGIIFSEFLMFNIDKGVGCCLFPFFSRDKEITFYFEILDKSKEEPVYSWEYTLSESSGEYYVSRWMVRDVIRIGVSSFPYFKYQLIK
jgi:hypothetical protein